MLIDEDFIISKADSKEFTIIMPFNNETHLKESIESIVNQSIGFKNNVQLILVGCNSGGESLDITVDYEKQFPENIFL